MTKRSETTNQQLIANSGSGSGGGGGGGGGGAHLDGTGEATAEWMLLLAQRAQQRITYAASILLS